MFGLISTLNSVLIKSVSIPEKLIDMTIDVLDGGAVFATIFKDEAVHAGAIHAEQNSQELIALQQEAN